MTNHAVSNRADLRERTKTMSRHGDRRGKIADLGGSFETINWLYSLFKFGIKTKTHFEWLLWHWSSLGQLNLEPTQPNGLVGCEVPTDLVKISVKEATHMGFYYITSPHLTVANNLHTCSCIISVCHICATYLSEIGIKTWCFRARKLKISVKEATHMGFYYITSPHLTVANNLHTCSCIISVCHICATYLSEIGIKTWCFRARKLHTGMSSAKRLPFLWSLDILRFPLFPQASVRINTCTFHIIFFLWPHYNHVSVSSADP